MDFGPPDTAAPLDLERRIASAPTDGRVKGMFFRGVQEHARKRGKRLRPETNYIAFRGYPLEEWLRFLPEAAEAVYPHLPVRAALRALGQSGFDALEGSTTGRVLFSLAGRAPSTAVSLIGKAFELIKSHGSVRVTQRSDDRAVVSYREIWDYIDSWHVGTLEGGLKAFGVSGSVRVRMVSIDRGDLEIRWHHAQDE